VTTEVLADLTAVDLTEIKRCIGVPFGGEQVKEPFVVGDFRRWVAHTDNYNPLHWNDSWAAESRFGQIVAPQSFMAIQAIGEGTYTMGSQPVVPYHSADEYFFYGPRVFAGDRYRLDRMATRYSLADTRYGPSVFLDVDINYHTARGMVVKKRATTMMHPAENIAKLGSSVTAGMTSAGITSAEPQWSDLLIAQIEKEKIDYIKSWRTHEKRLFASVNVGDTLARCVLGPHSGTMFMYAEAGNLEDAWGMLEITSDQPSLLPSNVAANGLRSSAQLVDPAERARLMPRARGHNLMKDGRGGHIYPGPATGRGMPRPFAVGTTLSVWSVDYLANWAGEWGFLRRSDVRFRGPVLSGDITYLDGVVTGKSAGPDGHGTVHVSYEFTDQNGIRSCTGTGDIELPLS
jgi:acyl dehydratase